MYRVDGLIDYYYQRRLSGMDMSDIEQSLNHQQHIEEEDRAGILQEVKRREEAMRLLMLKKKRLLIAVGVLLGVSLVALISYLN